jgi:hypothetical protein
MTAPPTAASDGRVKVGTQPARFADVTIDVYEYGTSNLIATTDVLCIIDPSIYATYLGGAGAMTVLPDHLRFDPREIRLKSLKCLGKYVDGRSIIWDTVRRNSIVDTEDLITAVRYQFMTHKVNTIVLEVQNPTAVTTLTPGMMEIPLQIQLSHHTNCP